MPTPPKKGESRQAFVSRCISHLIKKEGKTRDQAAGQCYSMFRRHKGAKLAGKAIKHRKK